jgi:hypothetical protein
MYPQLLWLSSKVNLIILLLEQIIMTIIIQPTAQKTRFSQKIMSKQNKMIPLGRFLLDITHDQAMLAKSQNLKIWVKIFMKYVEIKNSWISARNKDKKHSEHTYDEMEKIN